eukprot:scaffold56890_cov30-Attheya_sp.AAC.1
MTQNQTPEAPPGMGLDYQREEAMAFWRALTLSDFSAARDVLRKVTPTTPGAFVYPEVGEDVAAGNEAKGASQAVLLSLLYIAMKLTASQMSLFYVEADQYCMAPITKEPGLKKGSTIKYSTARGVQSTHSEVWKASPDISLGLVFTGERKRYTATMNPTEGIWFNKFMDGFLDIRMAERYYQAG